MPFSCLAGFDKATSAGHNGLQLEYPNPLFGHTVAQKPSSTAPAKAQVPVMKKAGASTSPPARAQTTHGPAKGPAKKTARTGRAHLSAMLAPALSPPGGVTPRLTPTGASALIDTMRAGELARDAIRRVTSTLDISQEKLFLDLNLPKSTMHARMAKGVRLAPLEQDRIYRTERIFERACAVLEDDDSARHWMQRTIRSLGGATPLSLLDTQAGYDLVMDTLAKIEAGVIS